MSDQSAEARLREAILKLSGQHPDWDVQPPPPLAKLIANEALAATPDVEEKKATDWQDDPDKVAAAKAFREEVFAALAAPSPDTKRLRDALMTARRVIVVACGDKAPFARIALEEIDAAMNAAPNVLDNPNTKSHD